MSSKQQLWKNKKLASLYYIERFKSISDYRSNWVQRLKFKNSLYFLNYRISPIQAISNLAMQKGAYLGLSKFFYKYYIKFLRANFSFFVAKQLKKFVYPGIKYSDYFSYIQLSKTFYDFNQVLFWRLIESDLYIRVRPQLIKRRGKKYIKRKFQFYLPKERVYLALRAFRTYFMLTSYCLKKSKKTFKALSSFFLKSNKTHALAYVKLQLYRVYMLSVK